jgi:hypothetical protein
MPIHLYEDYVKSLHMWYNIIVQEKGTQMRAIYFDMDGTIANFYGVDGWLDAIRNESVMPYIAAEPLMNPTHLIDILMQLKAKGCTIGIISWSAMGGSKEYNKRVRAAKLAWVNNYFGNIFDEFHVVKYGTPKHRVAKIKDSILVDDNVDVRDTWKNGATVDASNSENMVKELHNMLETLKAA